MFIIWAIAGALIGYVAADKRGFSPVGGVLGGLLLGPVAFLMFFISGISSADSANKKCPYCAEWIKAEATVCKHCRQPVAAPPAVRVRRSREVQ